MQLLYAATSVEFGNALRIALEGEGIETHFSDADLSIAGLGLAATGERMRIYVPTEDYPQAMEVLDRLLAEDEARMPAKPLRAPRKPMPMWVVVVGAAGLIAMVGAMVSP